VPATEGIAVVYDFGGTTTKHAIAEYHGGQLTRLRLLPSVATPTVARTLAEDEAAVGRMLADFMSNLMAQDLQELRSEGTEASQELVAAVASYIGDNHPKEYVGAGYMTLRHVAPNAGAWLTTVVSERLDRSVEVTLLHDGTAAARMFAGQDSTAVILLGTWLGVGFAPPTQDGLRPLATELAVS
jgi:hypothetical protein